MLGGMGIKERFRDLKNRAVDLFKCIIITDQMGHQIILKYNLPFLWKAEETTYDVFLLLLLLLWFQDRDRQTKRVSPSFLWCQ